MVSGTEITQSEPSLNMRNMRLTALGKESRQFLSRELNREKLLPLDCPSNWIGLMKLTGIDAQWLEQIRRDDNPTDRLLKLWSEIEASAPPTVGQLLEYLKRLDRWDVYDESQEYFERDLNRTNALSVVSRNELYDECITDEDQPHALRSYHAFILYAQSSSEDTEFAKEMKQTLIDKQFSVCTQDNLLFGFATTVGPLTKLISERCEHMIVILSPDFINSAENKFYMDYAQSLAIQTASRKIIPCVYRKCKLPSSYSFYHMIHYDKNSSQGPFYDFWDKLSRSLNRPITRSQQEPKSGSECAEINTNPAPLPAEIPSAAAAATAVDISNDTLATSVTSRVDRLLSEPGPSTLRPSHKKKSLFKNILKLSSSNKSKSKKDKLKESKVAVAS